MRIARTKVSGQRSTAAIKGRTALLVSSNVSSVRTPAGETAALLEVGFSIPVQPSRISATGIEEECRASVRVASSIPQAVLERSKTLIADGAVIALPDQAADAHTEVESVAMIGKHADDLPEDEDPSVLSIPFVRAK